MDLGLNETSAIHPLLLFAVGCHFQTSAYSGRGCSQQRPPAWKSAGFALCRWMRIFICRPEPVLNSFMPDSIEAASSSFTTITIRTFPVQSKQFWTLLNKEERLSFLSQMFTVRQSFAPDGNLHSGSVGEAQKSGPPCRFMMISCTELGEE
jgi:hypothetical protein